MVWKPLSYWRLLCLTTFACTPAVGRRARKEQTGYHVRSLVETTMFRWKTQFGDKLSARALETQATQVMLRCQVLNQMIRLGKPQSYKLV